CGPSRPPGRARSRKRRAAPPCRACRCSRKSSWTRCGQPGRSACTAMAGLIETSSSCMCRSTWPCSAWCNSRSRRGRRILSKTTRRAMNSQDAARFQDMGILPTQASSGAAQVDLLALAMLIFCALVLLAVFGLVLWFSWRYRAGSSVKRKPLSSERKQTAMEMIWAGGLFIVFMGFFYWGVDVYVQMYQQPDEDLTIEVVGKQWMWKLEHPNGAREIDTLH